MKECVILLFLAWNTWLDLRKREISLVSAGILGVIGLVWSFTEQRELQDLLFSAGVGTLFLALSIMTEGKIGMGDAWILIALGFVLDLQSCLVTLMIGLLFASVCSGYLLILKKRKRTAEIPFIPFLLLGYVGGLLIS